MRWFLVFLTIDTITGLFLGPDEYITAVVASSFQLIQLVIMLWIASDLLKDDRIARSVLLAYVIVLAIIAIGVVLQIPGFYADEGEGRFSGVDQNPNDLATNLAIAIVIVVGLLLYTSARKRFLLGLSIPLLGAIVMTGSRGGFLGFVIGCMVYLLPYARSKRGLTSILCVVVVIASTLFLVAKDPDSLERWEKTYYESDLTGRDEIFSLAVGMISEQPAFGWQPVNWVYQLGNRVGGKWAIIGRDAHNLFLALLLEVGVIGTVPYLIALWLCARSAWRGRAGNQGLLPLALLVTILVCGMSGTTLHSKVQWFICALTLASAPTYSKSRKRLFALVLR
jgi:O-antigen ligase